MMLDTRVTISAERYEQLTIGWGKREVEHQKEVSRLTCYLRAIGDAFEPFSFTGPTIEWKDLPEAITGLKADAEFGALVRAKYLSYVSKCNDVNASPYSLDLWLEERCPPDVGPVIDEQNELDRRLGTLVRKMPEGFTLAHRVDFGWVLEDIYNRTSGACQSPEQAFERGPIV